MRFEFNDGGRAAAGFKGRAGDCVCRAVAIASGLPYAEVYAALAGGQGSQRSTKRGKARQSARDGINVTRKWFKDYMTSIGFKWTALMLVGKGCEVHLLDGELPSGRLVVSVSKHYTCVINGVIYDTHDPQRRTVWYDTAGKVEKVTERCVYGYWEYVK